MQTSSVYTLFSSAAVIRGLRPNASQKRLGEQPTTEDWLSNLAIKVVSKLSMPAALVEPPLEPQSRHTVQVPVGQSVILDKCTVVIHPYHGTGPDPTPELNGYTKYEAL